MGSHLNANGLFQSDKYPWCKLDFVPLKVTDPMAQPVLWAYAQERRAVDPEFSDDLEARLRAAGYDPAGPPKGPFVYARGGRLTMRLDDGSEVAGEGAFASAVEAVVGDRCRATVGRGPRPGHLRAVLTDGFGRAAVVDVDEAFAASDPVSAARAAYAALEGRLLDRREVPAVRAPDGEAP